MWDWLLMWRTRQRILSSNYKYSGIANLLNSVLWKWYWVIIGGAILVTYTVYTHLPPGLIEGILTFIMQKIDMLNRVAANCTPLILNMPNFYQCLVNTN